MSPFDTSSLPKILMQLCIYIADLNGKAWLVGGSVRDLIRGHPPLDFDLEVYGIEAAALHAALQRFAQRKGGHVKITGQQFGVFKLCIDKLVLDIALPRSEKKTAHGHRGFAVHPDPFICKHKASLRRDFTINAMMFDPLEHTFIDDHGGQNDLKQKILRHVSPAFSEDPLRPLRAMQFAARLQLTLHTETATLCRTLLPEANTLPGQRIWAEWQKWSRAAFPSYGLRALQDSGWIALYPQLKSLIHCPQNPHWHPEGDVWIHTLQVCDQAAIIARRHMLNDRATEYFLFAALCHDFGKPDTTSIDASGCIVSPGHSAAGVAPTTNFLDQLDAPKQLANYIIPMIIDHVTHLNNKPTDRAVRRLAHRLEPANIESWEMLAEADASGRAPAPTCRPALGWLQKASQLQLQHQKPASILNGATLIQLGIPPGPAMGEILSRAYEAQLDGGIYDHQSALTWVNTVTQKSNLVKDSSI